MDIKVNVYRKLILDVSYHNTSLFYIWTFYYKHVISLSIFKVSYVNSAYYGCNRILKLLNNNLFSNFFPKVSYNNRPKYYLD